MAPPVSEGLSAAEKYLLLLDVAQAANSQLDLHGVLREAARALQPVAAVDALGIALIRGDHTILHALYLGDEPLFETLHGGRHGPAGPLPIAGSSTEEIARTRRPVIATDLEHLRRFTDDQRIFDKGGRAYVRVPLWAHDRLIGTLSFVWQAARELDPAVVELYEAVARPIATAVANSLAYAEIERLKAQLESENEALREEIADRAMFEEIIGESAALARVLTQVERVARTDAIVLLLGETGTGKEIFARALHARSPRSGRPLIAVNCAALPESLVGSELFGHERGAFTGAEKRRAGRFELADGGTIFLDEVGELPGDVQGMLLRVLQQGEFERVGGSETLTTDARVIAATNRDLRADVAAGLFRSDLYYRLSVFPIEVPPLRDRQEDIPLLARYFAARYATRLGKQVQDLSAATLRRLLAYPWPGNVRELQNVVERAVILADAGPLEIDLGEGVPPPAIAASGGGLPGALAESERRMIEGALERSGGRVSGPRGAALVLGLPAATLESKIRKLGVDKHRFRGLRRG